MSTDTCQCASMIPAHPAPDIIKYSGAPKIFQGIPNGKHRSIRIKFEELMKNKN